MATRWTRSDHLAASLYVCVAVALGFTDFYIRRNPQYVVTDYIPRVVAGTYEAPFIYRPLIPFLIYWLTVATGLKPMLVFVLTRLAFIFAALLVFHMYLRVWYSSAASLGGTLAVASLLPLTFTNSWPHPDSFPELLLFTLGCLLIARKRDGALFPVLAVAALNRETALFLVLLWANYRLREERSAPALARAAALTLVWAAVYLGLRWARGYQPYQVVMLKENLVFLNSLAPNVDPRLRVFGYFWLALFGIPGWLAIRGVRRPATPLFLKRTLGVALLFLLTSFAVATIVESRVFLPMFPLLAPSAMRAFVDVAEPDEHRERHAVA